MQGAIRNWIKSQSWGRVVLDAVASATVGPLFAYVAGVIGAAMLAWWASPSTYSRLDALMVFLGTALALGVLWVLVAFGWRWLHPVTVATAPLIPQSHPPLAPTKPTQDTWLQDAIFYIAHGRWLGEHEEALKEPGTPDKAEAGLKRLRQLARDGELTVWGKRWNNSTLDPIKPDYWSHHKVEFLEMLRDKPEEIKTSSATPEGKDEPSLRHLKVSKKEIERQWPSAGPLTPLWDAARHVYEQTRAADMYSHQSLDGKIQYHAIALTLDGRSQDPPIYAVRPGTNAFVVLPPSALSNTYMMKDDYSRIVDANLRDRVEWERVSVRMTDLDAHIARQKDDMRQHRAKGRKVWGDG